MFGSIIYNYASVNVRFQNILHDRCSCAVFSFIHGYVCVNNHMQRNFSNTLQEYLNLMYIHGLSSAWRGKNSNAQILWLPFTKLFFFLVIYSLFPFLLWSAEQYHSVCPSGINLSLSSYCFKSPLIPASHSSAD